MSDGDRLEVYLHGGVAGVLERRSQARLRFAYGSDWVDSGRQPLSLSLPVRAEPYEHEECAPFFEGLLPEGDFLKAIARTLHVSADNPFQLWTELGGECAGAVSVAPVGAAEPGQDPRPPRWLSEAELATLLGELPQRPLIAAIDEVEDGGGFRLSLAGAQDKVGVLIDGNEIGLSHGKPPTTAILKPPIPRVEESVANEAFCMTLGGHIDLDVAAAVPRLAESNEYLLVHRYDRSRQTPDGRLHQEDFCQALGLVPAVKYEREGGPTVAACAELIRRYCSAPVRDLTLFLDALLFNFVIANHDAHSKNYSLLLDGPGSVRLAPLYDLLSTAVYLEADRKLAMRYGGENRPAYLRGRHLDRLARDLAVKPVLVRRRALALRERMEVALEEARRLLPLEFQDRPIVERVIEMARERGEVLARRAGEMTETGARPTAPSGEDASGLGDTAEVVDAFERLTADLETATELFRQTREDLDALAGHGAPVARPGGVQTLLDELEQLAQRIKSHGREIFDAVVEYGLRVEGELAAIEAGEPDTANALGTIGSLTTLSGVAGEGIGVIEEIYAQVSGMEDAAPALREPVRNMRAGFRDALDARKIMVEWGRRASSIRSAGDQGGTGS